MLDFLLIFLNLRPEKSALIARFWPITTNWSPEIGARKLVAVKVIPLHKSSPHDRKILYFLKGSTGKQLRFTQKITLQPTNTADLPLRQHTGEPNSKRNQLTKTKAKVVSGRFSRESVIEYLSSNSSIGQKYVTRISFYSYLAVQFSKGE